MRFAECALGDSEPSLLQRLPRLPTGLVQTRAVTDTCECGVLRDRGYSCDVYKKSNTSLSVSPSDASFA